MQYLKTFAQRALEVAIAMAVFSALLTIFLVGVKGGFGIF